jgi:hypothetical protein
MFNTFDVLTVSVAAFIHNNNQYIKEHSNIFTFSSVNNNTPNSSTEWCNKDIMKAYFGADHYSVDSVRPPLVKVTPEIKEIAQAIKEYVKKDFFKIMSHKDPGAVLPYEAEVCQLLHQETVTLSSFGYIASVPQYYYINLRRDTIKNRIANLNSQHVGVVGGRVVLDNLEIIKKIKSKKFNGHIIQGICDGNLYFYFSSEGVIIPDFKEGDLISIDGKVKDHLFENDKYPMTKLTFVRYRASKNDQRNKSNN